MPPLELHAATPTGWRRFRDGTVVGTGPAAPPTHKPLYGHYDYRARPGGQGWDAYEAELRAAAGVSTPVSQILHGYSGSSHPSTFAASSVSAAQSKGVAAMLNTKITDWTAVAGGTHDALITGFFNSWPVAVPGWVTLNHEPENDGKNSEAAVWCAGIRRYIDLAAPIIRSRGLQVKVGGCLMDFSWDSTRWQQWKWWEGITPANLGQTTFGIDAYWKHNNVSGVVPKDPKPRINELVAVMRGAGISDFSLWETAIDRRQYSTGTVVGTQQSCADWWTAYADHLATIPEVSAVAYFHTPGGPASDQAWLDGPATAAFAQLCMTGRRL